MKKILTVFLIFWFGALAYAQGVFEDNTTQAVEIKKEEIKNTKKEKKKKEKKQKIAKKDYPKGYYGTLPDIQRDFKYKTQNVQTTTSTDLKPLEEGNIEEFKKAPNDTLFLDKIVKKEKSSNYVNDLQRVKYALSALKKSLEEEGTIQKIHGSINLVDLYSKNLKEKYENKSESFEESYENIQLCAYYAKLLGNLMYEANYYARYVPTNQGQYSKTNINIKKQDLLTKVNKTLFLISSEK